MYVCTNSPKPKASIINIWCVWVLNRFYMQPVLSIWTIRLETTDTNHRRTSSIIYEVGHMKSTRFKATLESCLINIWIFNMVIENNNNNTAKAKFYGYLSANWRFISKNYKLQFIVQIHGGLFGIYLKIHKNFTSIKLSKINFWVDLIGV